MTASPPLSRATLRILTWNVQWFCGLDGQVDVERVVRHALTLADFDVLCLQEVAIDYPGLEGDAGFDQTERVRQCLPGFEVFFAAAVDEPGRHGKRQRFGNLIATRLPVDQVHYQPLPWPADGGVRSMPRICASVTVLAPFGPVRVMTTHLEFYSTRQRLAQAHALVDLHRQACGHAAHAPLDDESGGPFQNKRHTVSAVLCGDFNFETVNEEYRVLQAAGPADTTRLVDAWTLAHPGAAHAPTFRLFDRQYGPEPISCDFFFISDDLAPRVRTLQVDETTQLSDHQPVLLELG